MYFDTLPKLFYPYKNQTRQTVVPDIFRRVMLDKFFANRMPLRKYYVKDFETPEILAHKVYGRSDLHWILLVANNITNVNKEWPMAQEHLVLYTKDKYGENNSSDTHHWILKEDKTVIVDWNASDELNNLIEPVSNLDYETEVNEKKRQINIVPEDQVKDLIETYRKLVG